MTKPPFFHLLPRATSRALEYLAAQLWLTKSQWYLAGGTAFALVAGHRMSVDLDFFSPQKEFSTPKLLSHFAKTNWKSGIIRENTVYGKLLGAKISFIAYPFFVPEKPFFRYGSIRLLRITITTLLKASPTLPTPRTIPCQRFSSRRPGSRSKCFFKEKCRRLCGRC